MSIFAFYCPYQLLTLKKNVTFCQIFSRSGPYDPYMIHIVSDIHYSLQWFLLCFCLTSVIHFSVYTFILSRKQWIAWALHKEMLLYGSFGWENLKELLKKGSMIVSELTLEIYSKKMLLEVERAQFGKTFCLPPKKRRWKKNRT